MQAWDVDSAVGTTVAEDRSAAALADSPTGKATAIDRLKAWLAKEKAALQKARAQAGIGLADSHSHDGEL